MPKANPEAGDGTAHTLLLGAKTRKLPSYKTQHLLDLAVDSLISPMSNMFNLPTSSILSGCPIWELGRSSQVSQYANPSLECSIFQATDQP